MKNLAAVFLALFLISVPLSGANATILFAGGEDSDFVGMVGTIASSTTAGTFASGYARESMSVSPTGCSPNAPPNTYFLTPTFTASSVIWIHANVYPASVVCAATGDILRVYSPDGYARIVVEQPGTGTVGQYSIYTRNQAGTQTLLVAMTTACFIAGHLVSLDLYVNYASSGEVTLYCNNTQVADYTGNILTDSATQLNQI